MRCPRCNGLMAYERFLSHLDVFHGWHCMICGEIVDATIIENRSRTQKFAKAVEL